MSGLSWPGFPISRWTFFNVQLCFVEQKKHLKVKVHQLLRRASTTSSVPDGKRLNRLEEVRLHALRFQPSQPPNDVFLPNPQQDEDVKTSKADSFRRWSEVKEQPVGAVGPQGFDPPLCVRRGRFWTRARRRRGRRGGRPASRSAAARPPRC